MYCQSDDSISFGNSSYYNFLFFNKNFGASILWFIINQSITTFSKQSFKPTSKKFVSLIPSFDQFSMSPMVFLLKKSAIFSFLIANTTPILFPFIKKQCRPAIITHFNFDSFNKNHFQRKYCNKTCDKKPLNPPNNNIFLQFL